MNTMRTEYFLFGWCRLVRLSLITVVSIIRLALLPVYSKGSRICKKDATWEFLSNGVETVM